MFQDQGVVYRAVQAVYAPHYDRLMDSGLYADLAKQGLIVAHEEVADVAPPMGDAYKVLRPERIPFISYPYEWSFSQLKDAALLTLRIQALALAKGMILKDASAFNVQFLRGRPIFIDTLSFETLTPGEPWVAYSQFCRHFLAPLALMAYSDQDFNLFRVFLDGVPLPVAARLLPLRTRFRFGLLMHLHMHARAQKQYMDASGAGGAAKRKKVAESYYGWLTDSLTAAVSGLQLPGMKTTWGDYYSDLSYSSSADEAKQQQVRTLLDHVAGDTVWDLGANTGRYSRIAAAAGKNVMAFDIDPLCVERNYLHAKAQKDTHILPLKMDLTNPSPALGWAHQERDSMADRAPADGVLALALIHHLAIGNNVPLPDIAAFFARLAPTVIVEFVPKGDPMVDRLLSGRVDIFDGYTEQGFEAAFEALFTRLAKVDLPESGRKLYAYRRKG